MTMNAEVLLRVRATEQSDLDLASRVIKHVLEHEKTITNGTAADKATKIWSDRRTLVGSADETLDLSALTDAFGVALAFTGIKLLMIVAAAANPDDLAVGAAATEQFVAPFGNSSDIVNVPPGGALVLINPSATGFPVVNNSSDKLKIANLGSPSATYEIVLIGI